MKNLFSPAFKRFISFFFIFLMLMYTYGCRYYFKTKLVPPSDIPHLEEIGDIHKYFIIHQGAKTMALSQIEVDSLQLRGTLDTISTKYYYKRGRDERYKDSQSDILHEIHFYLGNYLGSAEKVKIRH